MNHSSAPKDANTMPATTIFEVGNQVRFRPGKWNPANDLPKDGIFVLGAVIPLPNPYGDFVDKYYWDEPEWKWARGKTRLDVATHPQVLYLDGVPEYELVPPSCPDPEGKGRRSFSGAWFELV
jgi:hypothetical protein